MNIACRIFRPAQSRVRGGGKITNKRQSKTTKRITKMFGERKVQTEFRTKKQGKQRALSTTKMSSQQIDHNTTWADEVLTSFRLCGIPGVASRPLNTSIWPETSGQSAYGADPESDTFGSPSAKTNDRIEENLVSRCTPISTGIHKPFLPYFQSARFSRMERSLQSFITRINHPSIPPPVLNPMQTWPILPNPGLPHPMYGMFASQHTATAAPALYTREYLEGGGLPQSTPFTRELGLLWTTPSTAPPSLVPTSSIFDTSNAVQPRLNSSPNRKTHLFVTFGNEEVILDRKLIPPSPPAKHFSNDLDNLFKEWHRSNLLMVGDRGIPIKYWDLLYKAKASGNSAGWSVLRNEWGSWKVSADRKYRYKKRLLTVFIVYS